MVTLTVDLPSMSICTLTFVGGALVVYAYPDICADTEYEPGALNVDTPRMSAILLYALSAISNPRPLIAAVRSNVAELFTIPYPVMLAAASRVMFALRFAVPVSCDDADDNDDPLAVTNAYAEIDDVDCQLMLALSKP